MQILYNDALPRFWVYLYLHTQCWELMKSVGSWGSPSLPFMMKMMMVCHFLSDSHKVMTPLINLLPSICCSGDFSAMS
jgi:hypothetical protein